MMLSTEQNELDEEMLSSDAEAARFVMAPAPLQANPFANGAERRRGLRIRQNRPVKVYEPTSNRYIGGLTEDVSATGLRITLPLSASVQEGGLLNIHVGLSDSGQPLAHRRQMMPARVVWVERPGTPGRRQLQAGVELLSSISAQLDAA